MNKKCLYCTPIEDDIFNTPTTDQNDLYEFINQGTEKIEEHPNKADRILDIHSMEFLRQT